METVNLNDQQHFYMHFDTFIRTPGPIMNCNGISRGLVNRYGTLVGPDLSRPAPIDRPVGNPPSARMQVVKLMIGPRWLFRYPDYRVKARYHVAEWYLTV